MAAVKRTALEDARKAVREAKVSLDKGINPYKKAAPPTDAAPKPILVWDDCRTWFNHERREWTAGYQEDVMGWMEHDIGNPYPPEEGEPAPERLPHHCGHRETRTLAPARLAALFYREATDGTPDPDSLWLTNNETAQRVISILRRALNHAIATDDTKRFADWMNPTLALKSRLPEGLPP